MTSNKNILSSTAKKSEINENSAHSKAKIEDLSHLQDQLDDSVNLGTLSNQDETENNYQQSVGHKGVTSQKQLSQQVQVLLEKQVQSI